MLSIIIPILVFLRGYMYDIRTLEELLDRMYFSDIVQGIKHLVIFEIVNIIISYISSTLKYIFDILVFLGLLITIIYKLTNLFMEEYEC